MNDGLSAAQVFSWREKNPLTKQSDPKLDSPAITKKKKRKFFYPSQPKKPYSQFVTIDLELKTPSGASVVVYKGKRSSALYSLTRILAKQNLKTEEIKDILSDFMAVCFEKPVSESKFKRAMLKGLEKSLEENVSKNQ